MLLWRATLFGLSFLSLCTLPTRELRSEVSIREHVSGFSFSELRYDETMSEGVEEEGIPMINLVCYCDPHGPREDKKSVLVLPAMSNAASLTD